MEEKMTIPVIAGRRLVSEDDFLAGLLEEHPVSRRFIEAVRPTIRAIFMNIPDVIRARMIRLASDSFRRQSEAEEILRRAAEGAARLSRFTNQRASRRSAAVRASRERPARERKDDRETTDVRGAC
jgi:hypothetical protein